MIFGPGAVPGFGVLPVLRRLSVLGGVALLVSGCSTVGPAGDATFAPLPGISEVRPPEDYRIGPLDELKVTVFQEPDLSLEALTVDASGNILLPLVGQMRASGNTSTELSSQIAERLAVSYLVDPQVSVIVTRSTSQRVTVEGQVKKPGVFDLPGQTSLLQAVAMAEGPTDVARLSQVLVFRQIGEQRYAARFDLDDIREGKAPDPEILGNDVVVLNFSGFKGAYRDVLKLLPAMAGVFVAISNRRR